MITNKTAKRLLIRMPSWVPRDQVQCQCGGESRHPSWVGPYLQVEDLRGRERLEIEFPLPDYHLTATLDRTAYTLRFRGSTMVNVAPQPGTEAVAMRDGRLELSDKTRAVVQGLDLAEGKATVTAKSNAEAGIMLRWKDMGTFMLAINANGGIYFHEVVGGDYGQSLDFVPTKDLGPDILLTAEVAGSQATLTVTDGTQSVITKHSFTHRVMPTGGVGLFHNKEPVQSFDDFTVYDQSGRLVYRDHFDQPNRSALEWNVIDQRAGRANDYPIYRRKHMLGDKAGMVERRRYVLDRHIGG